jgi:hypothetical protein
MTSSGMLRRVTLVRTDVLEGYIASIFKVTRIGELGTTLAVTRDRSVFPRRVPRYLVMLTVSLTRRFLLP